MKHFYTSFFNYDPMPEITEAEARASEYFFEHDTDNPNIFNRYLNGKISEYIYRGFSDPTLAIEDLVSRSRALPARVLTLPVTSPDGAHGWREWHVSPGGQIESTVDRVFRANGGYSRITFLNLDGTPRGRIDYVYSDDDELLELLHYDANGNLTMREDADQN